MLLVASVEAAYKKACSACWQKISECFREKQQPLPNWAVDNVDKAKRDELVDSGKLHKLRVIKSTIRGVYTVFGTTKEELLDFGFNENQIRKAFQYSVQ